MHEVVPGKFIAFKGPADLGSSRYVDQGEGLGQFAPEHYIEPFQDFGVKAVIRLNEAQCDARVFERAGIHHHGLPF